MNKTLSIIFLLGLCKGLWGQNNPLYSAASIEDHFVPIPYQVDLHLGKTEVSQASYALFLESLKDPEEQAAYQPKKTNWKDYLPTALQDLEEATLFEKGHPEAPNAPVQNISYEAAEAYCAWLTEHYNSMDNNEIYYSKVVFRLPKEQEWELAASMLSVHDKSYQDLANYKYSYPWKSPSYQDKKGCALGNFNLELEGKATGGKCTPAYFSVGVEAYAPNRLGLYNMGGNVAEMVQEQGIAKGGSWYHSPAASTIVAQQSYTQPAPYVGFRILMEVLEEASYGKIPPAKKGPPGVLSLTPWLFMDQAEITNIDWLEYQFWMKVEQPEQYDRAVVDSTVWWVDTTALLPTDTGQVWDNFIAERRNLAYYYHNHPIYYDYPVVGVSHAQAKAYCAWRTLVVNEMLKLSPKRQKKFGYILYRLPTEKEWESAAQGGLNKRDFPHGYVDLLDRKGRRVINVNWSDRKSYLKGNPTPLVPALALMPNGNNYYNMIGNAAEMIDQPNIAKGGSWKHPKEQSYIYQQISYEQPEAWLGFRCICEIFHSQEP